jgi:hypothetical protein
MRIDLLTSPGCPHAAAARETVTDCLTTLGMDVAIVERVGRYPAPTVLVDGVDEMRHEAGASIGDVCRLDLPTPQRVLRALRVRHCLTLAPAAEPAPDTGTTTPTEEGDPDMSADRFAADTLLGSDQQTVRNLMRTAVHRDLDSRLAGDGLHPGPRDHLQPGPLLRHRPGCRELARPIPRRDGAARCRRLPATAPHQQLAPRPTPKHPAADSQVE